MKPMNVLIACEFTGIVRDAFIDAGHHAVSCDIIGSERGGPHIQDDVVRHLNDGWDLMVAFPPCTYLCSSGLHWNKRRDGRQQKTEEALSFVRQLMDAPIPKIAIENPVGCISTRIRKPDQKIQPWMFGEDASKLTCLWLKNLPRLSTTNIVPPKGWMSVKFLGDLFDQETEEAICDECGIDWADCPHPGPTQDGYQYKEVNGILFARPEGESTKTLWANQTPSGQNKLGPSPTRGMDRSRTYQGIAEAMGRQWGAT